MQLLLFEPFASKLELFSMVNYYFFGNNLLVQLLNESFEFILFGFFNYSDIGFLLNIS